MDLYAMPIKTGLAKGQIRQRFWPGSVRQRQVRTRPGVLGQPRRPSNQYCQSERVVLSLQPAMVCAASFQPALPTNDSGIGRRPKPDAAPEEQLFSLCIIDRPLKLFA